MNNRIFEENRVEIGFTDKNVADFYFFAIQRHTNSSTETHPKI